MSNSVGPPMTFCQCTSINALLTSDILTEGVQEQYATASHQPCVIVRSTDDSVLIREEGVPQGSFVGPLLFSKVPVSGYLYSSISCHFTKTFLERFDICDNVT